MWLISLLVVQSLCQRISAKLQEYYEDNPIDSRDSAFNYTINENDVETHANIHEVLQHFHQCRGKEWLCDKHCRLEFRKETKQCLHPDPGDNCFGISINYKYTRDLLPNGRFPHEFGILRRYPRCWSHLAPLICSTIFRPCSLHFFIEKDEHGVVKTSLVQDGILLIQKKYTEVGKQGKDS